MRACSLFLVAVCLSPTRARADTLPDPPAMQLQPGKLLALDGVRGRWWPLETAMLLADEHVELAKTKTLLKTHEDLLEVLRARIAEKDEALSQCRTLAGLSEARAQVAEAAIKHAETLRTRAEEEAKSAEARAHRWWRHPALWFALGIGTGAGIVAAAMK